MKRIMFSRFLAFVMALIIIMCLFSCSKNENTANTDYPKMSLKSDVDSVYSGTEQFRVALTIDGGEFKDDLDVEDFYRTNAFEKVDLEIISKSKKNVTLDVTGEMQKNVAGAYQWGVLGVKSSGIIDGHTDISTKIDVVLNYIDFDASSLMFDNGKAKGNLKICGVADVNQITKNDITIDGVNIENISKVDDTTINITMALDGANSVNDYVDAITGKKIMVGGYETNVNISQATFYPVFDKIEEAGNNFDITVKLYIYGGTIDNSIKTNDIILNEFFADGSIKSLKMIENNLGSLIISVPKGEMNINNYSFSGGITLKAGFITNAWGEKTSKDYSYTRDYSSETLGKAVTLNNDTLLAIQGYTRGLNTTFGTICYYGGLVGQVASIGKTILEATGILQSEHAETMAKLNDMDKKIDNIQTGINEIKSDFSKLLALAKEAKVRDYKREVDSFETLLLDFNSNLNDVIAIQRQASYELALEDAVNRGELDKLPSFAGMSSAEIQKEKEKLRNQYVPSTENMSDREAAEYNVRVMSYLNEKAKDINNVDYYSYQKKLEKLEELFSRICGMLSKPSYSNPITFYDELCSLTYNFDSQTHEFRLSTRVVLEYQLTKAIWAFAFHYKISSNESVLYNNRATEYGNAVSTIQNLKINSRPASEIKADVNWENKAEGIYISELYMTDNFSEQEALDELNSHNYIPIIRNMNEGAGGNYVYIGYKTTNDPSKAITNIVVTTAGVAPSGYKVIGYRYSWIYGNLNSGIDKATGIRLFYTKNRNEGEPIKSIGITSNLEESKRTIKQTEDVNKGAGGTTMYIAVDRANESNYYRLVGTDIEYHPYCYILGCKVAAYCSGLPSEVGIIRKYSEAEAFAKSLIEKHNKSMSSDEADDFISRIHGSNLVEEMTSAGFSFDHQSYGEKNSAQVKKTSFVLGLTYKDEGIESKFGFDYKKFSSIVVNYNKEKGSVTDYNPSDYVWFLLCF